MNFPMLNTILNDSVLYNKIKNIRNKDEYESAGKAQEIVYNHFDYFNLSNIQDLLDDGDRELIYQLENTDFSQVVSIVRGL